MTDTWTPPPGFHDYWAHINGVSELARATNLGSTGYSDWQEYAFKILFSTSRVQVFVDGVEEIDVLASAVGAGTSFSTGNFGFYNESQSGVRYSAVTQDQAPPSFNSVPLPASGWVGLAMLSVLGLVRRVRRRLA